MKVAILSDIHGNKQALDAVMEDIKKQNCEKVLCLGDLAMAGPEPNVVIDFVKSQNDWEVIQGNTDKLIADFTPEFIENMKDKFPVMANALLDDIKVIDDKRKDYLKNLPPKKEIKIEGVKILMVHGSPRRNNEDILPNMSVEEIQEIFEGVNADIVFCGHTHVPCGYQNKVTVVNVGSVGRPMTQNPQSCYCVADFKNGTISVEHRFIDYDRQKAASIMLSRNFDGTEKLADMILNPTERHV